VKRREVGSRVKMVRRREDEKWTKRREWWRMKKSKLKGKSTV